MKLLGLEKKYEGNFLTYYVAKYENSLGGIKYYEFVSRDKNLTVDTFHNHNAQGVGMVCFSTDRTKILMQEEFRMATNEWVYNFPAGLIDEGEDCYTACKRELKEETGVDLVEVIAMLSPSYASQGTSDEEMNIAIVTCEGEIRPSDSPMEEIRANWFTKEDVKKLLDNNALMSVRTQMFCWQWINEK